MGDDERGDIRIWVGAAAAVSLLALIAWPLLIAAAAIAAVGFFLWQRERATAPHWSWAWLPASDVPFRPRPVGWHPDPYGHADRRYWDGHNWTDRVATGGVATRSPV
ncbi:MAG TPA: DUF2510 domain-containing protein [Acidimicrobiales bacterium]|jgi:hypothetical protein